MSATYADKPWTKSYDSHVPVSMADLYQEVPLYQLLDETVAKLPNKTACIMSARLPVVGRVHNAVSYKEIGEMSDKLAAALSNMGLQKGDRVALVCVNSVQFVAGFFGILKAGGIVVALNPTFPPAKWAEQLKDADIKYAISMSLFYKGLNSVRSDSPLEKVIVTNIKEYLPPLARTLFTLAKEKKEGHFVEALQASDTWWQDVMKNHSPGQRPKVEIDARKDTAIFQYTGGTTGVPKAARGPHFALATNALQMQYWMRSDLPPEREVTLAAIPMFHVYGMVAVMTFAVSSGATMVMVPNARDIDDLLDNIETYKPTLFMGVPALYNALNNHPKVTSGQADLSSIRGCISGSAPLAPETKRRFEELTGGVVMEGFGMSEAPTATHCNPFNGENRAGSIGLPFPDVECRIISLDDGKTEMPIGTPGELVMHGPVMMTGYHNMPTETNNALRDGWLYTGDIAQMDEDGYFYIVDRKKDMVLIGGFNVYPTQIEKYMKEHPDVLEIAVAGIPHPDKEGQEALKAWVVRQPGSTLTAEDMIAHCEKKLAHYEIPRRIEFVDELPKTAVGKILRRELVKQEVEASKN